MLSYSLTHLSACKERINLAWIFFLVSGDLLPSLKECKPSATPAINLFDHKSVVLFLGVAAPPASKAAPRLRNCNMDNPLLLNNVTLAAYRCYSFGISSEPANEANAPIRELLSNIRTRIKHISDKLSEVSSLLRQHACAESTPLGEMRISAIYAGVGMAFADLPSLDELSQFPKTSNDSTFFEALAEQTKLAGIKTQKLLFCMQNIKKGNFFGKNRITPGKL